MKKDSSDDALARSSSGTFSTILFPIGPPARPHVVPSRNRPTMRSHVCSTSMRVNIARDTTMHTHPAMTKGLFPISSAFLPTQRQNTRVATAGISRYRPLPMVSRPISIWR